MFYIRSDSGGVFDFSSKFIHRVRPLWVATKANVTPNLFSNSVLKSHRNIFQHFNRFRYTCVHYLGNKLIKTAAGLHYDKIEISAL